MEPTPVDHPEQQVVFRPSKKRKIYRQRTGGDLPKDASSDIEGNHPPDHVAESTFANSRPGAFFGSQSEEDDDDRSVLEALRLRQARKMKLRGVEFRSARAQKDESGSDNEQQRLPIVSDNAEFTQTMDAVAGGINRRFAPQTGIVGELVNKHMEEYIETELAKRHSLDITSRMSEHNFRGENDDASLLETVSGKNTREQPVMLGKLQEIDLGEEARIRNVAMTDRARRRLEGERGMDEEISSSAPRPRVGRDGRPWRPRKRRASDDIKRDQLVEDFLRENRLDVYDVSSDQVHASAAGDDEAADERIAEEFRREFMDAMSQRRQRKKPTQAPGRGAKKEEEPILKGPKLGGSRNVRAAMRDLLLKKEMEKKK